MPIRAENKARYPKNWREIRARILTRAKNDAGWPCCESCGAPNHGWIERRADGRWFNCLKHDAGAVYIVLTIAHLNHTPEDNRPSNLRAWCQKCHNAYDAPTRRAGIAARSKALKAVGDLFP